MKSILSRIPGFGWRVIRPLPLSRRGIQASGSARRGALHGWRWFIQLVIAATVVALAGCGGGGSDPAPSTVPPPVITVQPLNVTNIDGGSAAFRVTASGVPPLSYQWRRNGIAVPGATDTLIGLTATLAGNGDVYSVVVSNAGGTVTSNDATLTVTPVAPTVVVPPQNTVAAAGQSATFTVNAIGSEPLSYQWRRNGVDIVGAVGASYATPATTVADDGAAFSVVVTNAAGSRPSGNGILTVTEASAWGSLVLTGSPATQFGGAFNAQAGVPILAPQVSSRDPNCFGTICSSQFVVIWVEIMGTDPSTSTGETLALTFNSVTNTLPGVPPGQGVTELAVSLSTATGTVSSNFLLVCGGGNSCAAPSASGVTLDQANRSVTFTNVSVPPFLGGADAVIINGTLKY